MERRYYAGLNLVDPSELDATLGINAPPPVNSENIQYDGLFSTLTPVSEPVFGGFGEYQIILGRGGNDVIYGFDHSLSEIKTPIHVDIMVGDSEPVELLFYADLLNTILGNPPSIGSDRFVLGDWRKSYYSNNGDFDYALIVDFNHQQDVIQLHGTADDYAFIGVPFLGTAIYEKSETSPFFWDGDLVGVVFWAFGLEPSDPSIRYVGDTPPSEIAYPEIEQLGTEGIDWSLGIDADAMGNIYVSGTTNGSLEGTNAGSYDIWIAKYNSDGEQLWIQQLGGVKRDNAFEIATDQSGNFYVVGDQGEINGNEERQAVWIAKYDTDGNQLWSREFGDSIFNGGSSVTVDSEGNAYVSGITLTGDRRPGSIIDAQDDFWITKFDSDGNQEWYTQVGSPLTSPAIWDEAYGVTVSKDGSGSLYATGWTYGGLVEENAGLGFYDAWIGKFTTEGELVWIEQFGTPTHEFAWSIDTDSQGDVYSYGWTEGELGETNLGDFDLWLTKYDSDGNQLWTEQFGTSSEDGSFIGGLEIDSNDNLFVTGYTNGNFGGQNAGSYDAWVARYNTEGEQIWVQQFGTSELDYATNLTVDNLGNVYVTGFTEGSLGDINNGAVDTWIAKLDANSGDLQNFNTDVNSAQFIDFNDPI